MDSPFMGQIQAFGFNFAPSGWALCQGQTMNVNQYQALFALLGVTYGGNGTQTFQLPDLRGRVPIGQGNGPNLTPRVIGSFGGAENASILISNMPSHTHTATFTASGGGGSITASLMASTMVGTQNVPGTAGATTLGAPAYGTGRAVTPVPTYVADANPTVALTGLSVTGGAGGGTVTNAVTGQGLPLATISPFLCVNYSIALQGLFPSRN
jgi:microcystin-dependent protein